MWWQLLDGVAGVFLGVVGWLLIQLVQAGASRAVVTWRMDEAEPQVTTSEDQEKEADKILI